MRRPEDFGMRKIRGGHRWEEWERADTCCGHELVDEETGERVVYINTPTSRRTAVAWSDTEAVEKIVDMLEREGVDGDEGVRRGTVDPEFDIGGGF